MTRTPVDTNAKDSLNPEALHVGPLPLSMVSSKGAGGGGALSMASSKDAKEVGNREHHTHSGICVAFHLRFAAEKEWRVFVSFPIRLGKRRNVEQLNKINT